MLSISTIKLLFLAGGIILCVLIARGFKSDPKRFETASKLVKQIQDQRDQLLKKNKP